MKKYICLICVFAFIFGLSFIQSSEVTVSDIFMLRHSGKSYDATKEVSDEQMMAIMEAARWTPSSHNDQPWYFIICDRSKTPEAYYEVLQTLKGTQQDWVRNAPVLIVVISRENQTYNNKPNEWAQYDTGAAALSLSLQASDLGLMAHQIGGFNKESIASKFELPDNHTPLTIIVVGYEAEDPEDPPAPRVRRPVRETFFYGEWGNSFLSAPFFFIHKEHTMSSSISTGAPSFSVAYSQPTLSSVPALSCVIKDSLESIKKALASLSAEERTKWANTKNEKGMTPLALAIEAHNPPEIDRLDIIKFLINECRANPNLGDNENWTPLYRASTGKRTEILSVLLDHGADPNIVNKDGSTPLHRSVDRGNAGDVRILLAKGAQVNAVNCFGTPLAYAAKNGNLLIASLLLDAKADPNLVNDPLSFTPAELAANNQKNDMVQLLSSRQGKVIIPLDSEVHTSLSRLVYGGNQQAIENSFLHGEQDEYERTAAHYCAYLGKNNLLKQLKKLGDIDTPDKQGRTPLHYAIMKDQQKTVAYLIEETANCSLVSKDLQGYSSIFWACQYNRVDIVRALLLKAREKGELVKVLEAQDNFGWKPIHKAAQVGSLPIVYLLVKVYGTDMNQKTKNGRTPLDLATATNATAVIEFLKSQATQLPLGAKKV
jgi:ankyrin repeat protein/nitroreductase